jgi:hypothetical protein
MGTDRSCRETVFSVTSAHKGESVPGRLTPGQNREIISGRYTTDRSRLGKKQPRDKRVLFDCGGQCFRLNHHQLTQEEFGVKHTRFGLALERSDSIHT